MIKIISVVAGKYELLNSIVPGCWVQVIEPTPEDVALLEANGIRKDFIHYALDEEEISRFESEDGQTLLIIDLPVVPRITKKEIHSTIPATFIVLEDFMVSISLHDNSLFNEVEKLPTLNTSFKTRTILQFIGRTAFKYISVLKEIDRIVSKIEERAVKSISNTEFMELMKVQKSLVYIATSLKSNQSTLDRIKAGKVLKTYEEDNGLLEDVIIEISQAREMADIHERILTNTMDNYNAIIANNLNDIMKFLTSLSFLSSIPMIIFGLYGMNVGNLWFANTPYFAIGITIAMMGLCAVWFVRKRML